MTRPDGPPTVLPWPPRPPRRVANIPAGLLVCWQAALVLALVAIGRPAGTVIVLGVMAAAVVAVTGLRPGGIWTHEWALLWLRQLVREQREPAARPGPAEPELALLALAAGGATVDQVEIEGHEVSVISHRSGCTAVLELDPGGPPAELALLPLALAPLAEPDAPAVAVQLLVHTAAPGPADRPIRCWLAVQVRREPGFTAAELSGALVSAVRRLQRRLRPEGRTALPLDRSGLMQALHPLTGLALAGPTGTGPVGAERWHTWWTGPVPQQSLAVRSWPGSPAPPDRALFEILLRSGGPATVSMAAERRQLRSAYGALGAGTEVVAVELLVRLAAPDQSALAAAARELGGRLTAAGMGVERLDGRQLPGLAATLPLGGFLGGYSPVAAAYPAPPRAARPGRTGPPTEQVRREPSRTVVPGAGTPAPAPPAPAVSRPDPQPALPRPDPQPAPPPPALPQPEDRQPAAPQPASAAPAVLGPAGCHPMPASAEPAAPSLAGTGLPAPAQARGHAQIPAAATGPPPARGQAQVSPAQVPLAQVSPAPVPPESAAPEPKPAPVPPTPVPPAPVSPAPAVTPPPGTPEPVRGKAQVPAPPTELPPPRGRAVVSAVPSPASRPGATAGMPTALPGVRPAGEPHQPGPPLDPHYAVRAYGASLFTAASPNRARVEQLLAIARTPQSAPQVVPVLAGRSGQGASTTAAGLARTLATVREDHTALLGGQTGPIDAATIREVTREHAFTVIDLGGSAGEETPQALAVSTRVVVVAAADRRTTTATRTILRQIHLVHPAIASQTVIAVVCRTARQYRRVVRELSADLSPHAAQIVPIPHDPAIRDVDHVDLTRLAAPTREAFLRLAAAVALPRATAGAAPEPTHH